MIETYYDYFYKNGESGFMYPCLIRKNDAKLRKQLIKFGWRPFGYMYCSYILCDHISGEFETVDEEGLRNALKNPFNEEPAIVDCGVNEDLFLAVAALNYGTDEFQWFTYPEEGYWYNCDYANMEEARENLKLSVQMAAFHCSHKANVEELIEHFK